MVPWEFGDVYLLAGRLAYGPLSALMCALLVAPRREGRNAPTQDLSLSVQSILNHG